MGVFVRNKVRVETTALTPGHLVLVTSEGVVKDLGTCSVEDLRLTAWVGEQAYARLTPKKARTGASSLGRVRTFTHRLYDLAVK